MYGIKEILIAVGVSVGIADDNIGAILERILALHGQPVDGEPLAVQEGVFRHKGGIPDGDVTAHPAEFLADDGAAADGAVVALPQSFDATQFAVYDMQIPVVPHGGTAAFRGFAVDNVGSGHVPEGIAEIKKAFFRDNIPALF